MTTQPIASSRPAPSAPGGHRRIRTAAATAARRRADRHRRLPRHHHHRPRRHPPHPGHRHRREPQRPDAARAAPEHRRPVRQPIRGRRRREPQRADAARAAPEHRRPVRQPIRAGRRREPERPGAARAAPEHRRPIRPGPLRSASTPNRPEAAPARPPAESQRLPRPLRGMHRLRLPRTHRIRTRLRGTRTPQEVPLGGAGPHAAALPLREAQPSVSTRPPETPARDEEQASAGARLDCCLKEGTAIGYARLRANGPGAHKRPRIDGVAPCTGFSFDCRTWTPRIELDPVKPLRC